MSSDILRNPLSLFDVAGNSALITGATGALITTDSSAR
jgi:hypothetical protein